MRSLHATQGRARLVRNIISVITLGAFLVLSLGCSTWKVKPVTTVHVNDYKLVKKEVRFHLENGSVVIMHVTEVDYPYVRGKLVGSPKDYTDELEDEVGGSEIEKDMLLEVDCRDVAKMEIKQGGNAGVVILVVAAITVVIIIIASAASSSSKPATTSSQSSCPVLYVQDGDLNRLVGEPYAGAAAGSIQRRDMMPLPALDEGRARLCLANEAHETQYTDFAEVVIIDHVPGTRAVATNDQEVILVGEAQLPGRVVDISGSDVTASVARIDGNLWQTDLSKYVDDKAAPLTEELVISFPQSDPGDQPVLELELSNTYWLDMVMNRFFALLGDKFDKGMEKAGQESNGPRIRQWIEREGVDLKVEWHGPGGWEEIGVVSSAGPLALRHVAVPLPAAVQSLESSEITLRVTGGSGFWKIDQIGLSMVRDKKPAFRRIGPDFMQSDQGVDQRDLIAATDGRYQILAQPGDKAYLEFDLPPTVPGMTRTAFFHSDGYYVAHKPIQSEQSLSTMKTILDEEGALARFSLDLYRKYHEIAQKAPRLEGSLAGSS